MATFLLSHPDTGLVYCDHKLIDATGQVLAIARKGEPTLLTRKNVVGACFLYRRGVAEVVGGYDATAILAEDYDYWLRIGKVAAIAHLAGVAPYRYRIHEGSLTCMREAEGEIQGGRVRARHARTWREARAALADGHRAAGQAFRMGGRHWAALTQYVCSIWHNPWQVCAYRGLVATFLMHRPRGGWLNGPSADPRPSDGVAGQPNRA